MKKIIPILLIMLLLTGCSNSNSTIKNNSNNDESNIKTSDIATKDKITFADPIFEKYIRTNLSKVSGDVTLEDLSEIKQIDINSNGVGVSYKSYDRNKNGSFNITYAIKSDDGKDKLYPSTLEDLKYFNNLEYLKIDLGLFSDTSSISSSIDFLNNMPNIKYLYVKGCPHNLTPLTNCNNLENLGMNFDQVTDFSAFEKLNNLKQIYIMNSKEEEKDIQENIKKYLKSDNVRFGDFA